MSAARWIWVPGCVLLLAGAVQGCAAYGNCAAAECRADADTTAHVRALFDQYPELQPPNLVYVLASNGVVTLTGMVNTEYSRRMAESVALQADGVRRVVNFLGVDNGGK
jgi:osmotically-inducible protein OsmY